MEMRDWQKRTYADFVAAVADRQRVFSFEATMGAGKTFLAAKIAKHMLDDQGFDFVIFVAPWDEVRGNEYSGAISDMDKQGLRTSPRLFAQGKRVVSQPTPHKVVFVIMYQSTCNAEVIELLEAWKSRGCKFGLIFDEVHHTSAEGGQWGQYAEMMHEAATMTVTMSGTYFRSDGHRIRFLDYGDNGRPRLSSPGYTYAEAVADKVVRAVTFRYEDPTLECFHEKKGDETHLLSTIESGRRLHVAKREVLRPDGECVRALVREAHAYMCDLRQKYPDAGLLISCQPSSGRDEERYVHQVTQLVRNLTREEVIEVVSSDPNAAGKLERFRNGTIPYLVSINKISEGVNIPRLRAAMLLRYMESEMQFRQIVGRTVRSTDDDDGTAACIFMPKFASMYAFAMNMYNESLEGIRNLRCDACGEYPCECPCVSCGSNPCECGRGSDSQSSEPARFEILDVVPQGGGGSLGADDVYEQSIAMAKVIKQKFIQHRHSNAVQLAHVLQEGIAMSGSASAVADEPRVGPLAEHNRIQRKVARLMGTVTARFFGGDYSKAWSALFRARYGIDWKEARLLWPNEKLREFEKYLEKVVREGHT